MISKNWRASDLNQTIDNCAFSLKPIPLRPLSSVEAKPSSGPYYTCQKSTGKQNNQIKTKLSNKINKQTKNNRKKKTGNKIHNEKCFDQITTKCRRLNWTFNWKWWITWWYLRKEFKCFDFKAVFRECFTNVFFRYSSSSWETNRKRTIKKKKKKKHFNL